MIHWFKKGLWTWGGDMNKNPTSKFKRAISGVKRRVREDIKQRKEIYAARKKAEYQTKLKEAKKYGEAKIKHQYKQKLKRATQPPSSSPYTTSDFIWGSRPQQVMTTTRTRRRKHTKGKKGKRKRITRRITRKVSSPKPYDSIFGGW